jgi:serine/threonine protein kinase
MGHELSRQNCRPRIDQPFEVNGEKYILGGELGSGAVGLVRKATRIKDNKYFAVKFLAPDPNALEEAIFDDVAARFQREGERGSMLNHPNLLKIYAYCSNKNGINFEAEYPINPFLLMERVTGKSLDIYIQKKLVSERSKFIVSREKLHIACQITNAISELHRSKLIHRDIKPANIFFFRNNNEELFPLVKLGDFGIVKWGDFHASLTTGVLTSTFQKGLGTLKYMSPEQAIAPKDLTVRSDIFSLGITLFELFTGQILASPHHVYEVMSARLTRGTTLSRYLLMNYTIHQEDESIAELILDMHRRGQSGRPSIERVKGILEHEYEQRFGNNWEEDTNWDIETRFEDSWDD